MTSSATIAERVVQSIQTRKLRRGGRLGEREMADLFGINRTVVREALIKLQARGFIEVRPRLGWYVVEPSFEEARETCAARRVIEPGMLRDTGKPLQTVIRKLCRHVAEERKAIASCDAGTRSVMLADFHVCLAGCLGSRLLTGMLVELSALGSRRAPRWSRRSTSRRRRRRSRTTTTRRSSRPWPTATWRAPNS